jgi:RimJ/RimL family protein N-acetyltransferase
VDTQAPATLSTGIPGLTLRMLTGADARAFYDLVQANRAYLTRYGDYLDLVGTTLADLENYFSTPPGDYLRMGVWRDQTLVGRVDLNPVAPGVLVLGYWICEAYAGHGYATAACRALIETTRAKRPGNVFWAGVRHENVSSAAVVEKLGFTVVEELPDRKRYRLV